MNPLGTERLPAIPDPHPSTLAFDKIPESQRQSDYARLANTLQRHTKHTTSCLMRKKDSNKRQTRAEERR